MPRAKKTDVYDNTTPDGKAVSIHEIGAAGSVEAASDSDMYPDAIEREAFMNEYVDVLVHPSPIKDDLDVVVPNVNGTNQPIVRGVRTRVRRKYVEALARCCETKYTQQVMDPSKPEQIQMVPYTVPKYPFSMVHDENPNGPVWLKQIVDSIR